MIKKNKKAASRPPHRMLNEKSFNVEPPNTANWSEAQDRGEDLATMKDPFVQKRTGDAPNINENLADRFDRERNSPPL
jgi:hypothetical protein